MQFDRQAPSTTDRAKVPYVHTGHAPKRYLWLLGLTIPALVVLSWPAALATGLGLFWWSGPILMFGIVPILDFVVGCDSDNLADDVLAWLENDRYYRRMMSLYLPLQYASLILACWLWSGGGWIVMEPVDKVGLMITVGGISGIAINAAHELGHKRAQSERWMSKIALAQACYGHFYVEHNRGHHVRVATPEDPASSQMGDTLYGFFLRSTWGSLRSAWAIEAKRLEHGRKSRWSLHNDVINAWLMSAVLYAALLFAFGVSLLPWLIGQAILGILLLEAVNYLEHYGLRRLRLANGRYEPVRPSHSWNSNATITNLFLFHLQRHSDHHAHPLRRYQALRHARDAPQLPAGYAGMILLAAVPPWWRRVMDPRVLDHYGGDAGLAALRPRRANRLLNRVRPDHDSSRFRRS